LPQNDEEIAYIIPWYESSVVLIILSALRLFFDELLNKLPYLYTPRFFLIHGVVDPIADIVPDNLKGSVKTCRGNGSS